MHCVDKEQDTFPTTYAKDYTTHKIDSKPEISSGFDAFALTEDEQKAFFDINAIKEIPWEEQLAIIKNLYAQRMKTTYYVSYCEDAKKKQIAGTGGEEEEEDSFLTAIDKVYSSKTEKVLQPVSTSRRVMGYCRPAYYYTGLTEYQDEYGKYGYQRLLPSRDQRLKPRLTFCDQFKSKH